MRTDSLPLTGVERTFGDDEIIVSKTDLRGKITYANRVFLRIADYTEEEVLNAPHCIVRHPSMPRCVFKLLWDTIAAGREIFAYVLNRSKNGDHYWVFAHVTPTFDSNKRVIGYHSNRRSPKRTAVGRITPIYDTLLAEEQRHQDIRAGMAASGRMLADKLASANTTYDEFVFSL